MKAGIKFKKGERHGLHTLRNSLAKNMLDAGAPLPVISQTLGHQNVNTTAIYLKIDIDEPIINRARRYFQDIKNPYIFRVGDIGVKINCSGDKNLADSIVNIASSN